MKYHNPSFLSIKSDNLRNIRESVRLFKTEITNYFSGFISNGNWMIIIIMQSLKSNALRLIVSLKCYSVGEKDNHKETQQKVCLR
jgi:hypothetical protein